MYGPSTQHHGVVLVDVQHNLRLTDLAHALVTRQLTGRLLLDHSESSTTSPN